MVRAILGTILANVGYDDVLMADSGASAFRLLGSACSVWKRATPARRSISS